MVTEKRGTKANLNKASNTVLKQCLITYRLELTH